MYLKSCFLFINVTGWSILYHVQSFSTIKLRRMLMSALEALVKVLKQICLYQKVM